MEHGTWSISPCSHADVRILVAELGRGRRLLRRCSFRRGYSIPRRRSGFSRASCLVTTRFALGDMREAVEAIRGALAARALHLRPRGLRRRRASARPRSRCCCCGRLGADPAWHCRRGSRRGLTVLNARRSPRLAEDGSNLVLTVDCGSRPWQRSRRREARARGGRHRPSPALALHFSRLPGRCAAQGRLSVLRALRKRAVVWKLAEALLGSGTRSSSGISTSWRWRRSAERRAARRRERALRARRPAAARRRRRKPVCAPSCGPAGRPGGRLRGSVGFRLAPRHQCVGAALPSVCRAPPAAHRRPARGELLARRARGAETGERSRRGADPGAPPSTRSSRARSKRRRRAYFVAGESGTEA